MLDVVERDIGEIVLTVADCIRRDTIDHDEEVVRFAAAYAELRQRTTRPGLVHVDARKRPHHVGELGKAAGAHFLAGHRGDGRAAFRGLDWHEARRDDKQLGQQSGLSVGYAAECGEQCAGREAGS